MTREEAIRRIKAWNLDSDGRDVLAVVIPEFHESEDERIRKVIVKYFKELHEESWINLEIPDILAWLEKQKEQNEELVYRLNGLMQDYIKEGKDDEEKEHRLKCYQLFWDALEDTNFFEQKEQKPIKMEVYEVGKGTTICGQDYKCKKDYKEGNCWYIKDVVYHCSRDGYLTDQNGISWSCTPEWFNEYIYTNNELVDEEKNNFVSGQFLQCKLSFDCFKEGEHYWLEYIGNDMYVGRSDNILNQKFHITPRQLYTLFSQQLDEAQEPPKKEEQVSSEYETPMFEETPSDEQIIDALIHHLNEQDGFLTAINCVSTKAILSWLKKQKEQKPAESISQLTVQGKGVYKICPRCKERMVRDDSMVYTSMPPQYRYECPKCGESECDTVMYDNPKMEEQKPVVTHGETYHVDTLGTQQVIAGKMPQKPSEWSEEDEDMIQDIIASIDTNIAASDFHEMEDWLKSLKPRLSDEEIKKIRSEEYTNGFNDCLLGKQKGWSKGDEEMLDSIIKVVCGVGSQPNGLREKQVRFLESLRPSWKPSKDLEEAVEELFETIEIQEHENIFEDTFKKIFIAGVEWQKQQKLLEWSDNFEENIQKLLHDKLTWHSEDGSISSTVFINDKTLKDIINGIWFYVGKEALKYPNKELNVAEWNEEDEKIRQGIIKDIEFERNFTSATTGKVIGKYNEQINWLKFLPLNLKKKNEDVAKLCSNEWSEEDEKMVKEALYCVGYTFGNTHPLVTWLKSLRPHWKPSEEQMKALDKAIPVCMGVVGRDEIAPLESLCEELRKL